MANIKAAIQLYDGVSAPAAKMARALNTVKDAFAGVDRAGSRGFSPEALEEARRKAEAAQGGIMALTGRARAPDGGASPLGAYGNGVFDGPAANGSGALFPDGEKARAPAQNAPGSRVADETAARWGALAPAFAALETAAGRYAAGLGNVRGEAMLALDANRAFASSVSPSAFAPGMEALSASAGGFAGLWAQTCGDAGAGWNDLVYGVLLGARRLRYGLEETSLFSMRIGAETGNFFDNLWTEILTGMQRLTSGALGLLGRLMEGINPFLKGAGLTELAPGRRALAGGGQARAGENLAARWFGQYGPGLLHLQSAGADSPGVLRKRAESALPETWADIRAPGADRGVRSASGGTGGPSSGGGAAADHLADTARDTARAADSLESVSMDLSFLRELAERRAVSQYTNANVTLDMSGMQNSFSSEMDVDGFVDVITVKLDEALSASAEGVHW